jgi:hypothetical protein
MSTYFDHLPEELYWYHIIPKLSHKDSYVLVKFLDLNINQFKNYLGKKLSISTLIHRKKKLSHDQTQQVNNLIGLLENLIIQTKGVISGSTLLEYILGRYRLAVPGQETLQHARRHRAPFKLEDARYLHGSISGREVDPARGSALHPFPCFQ